MMTWDDWEGSNPQPDDRDSSHLNFDFLSLVSNPKDYYKILEVDYDASDDDIRSNFIRLALKWHPDKRKGGEDGATSRFQEINEAYQVGLDLLLCCQVFDIGDPYQTALLVLSDLDRRREYDEKGPLYFYDYNLIDYLNRYKGLILTCNGLGIKNSIW